MKITVVIPIYHGKQYIQQILDMMGKNIKTTKIAYELELVFVNDDPENRITGAEVADARFATKVVENEKNSGIHFSRVQGLEHASGEYVMFFDQDDRIAEDYFESQLRIIQKSNVAVVVANGIAQAPTWDKLLYKYWFMQWTVKHMWFYTRFDCRIISPGQCLIRKEIIPEIWKNEILTRNGADDYYLWLALLAKETKFCINRKKLYTHVYTSNNTSLDNTEMKLSVQQFLEIDAKYGIIPYKYHVMIQERMEGKIRFNSLVRLVERINKK